MVRGLHAHVRRQHGRWGVPRDGRKGGHATHESNLSNGIMSVESTDTYLPRGTKTTVDGVSV